MAQKKQSISFNKAAQMATKFADEVIESFEKLIGRRIYDCDRDTVYCYLVVRAFAVLERRFRVRASLQKATTTKRA